MDTLNLHKYSNKAIRDHYDLPDGIQIIRDVHQEMIFVHDKYRMHWVGMIGGTRIAVSRDTEFPGEHFIVFRPSVLKNTHFHSCDKYSKQKNKGHRVYTKATRKTGTHSAKSAPRKQKAPKE